MMVKSGLVFFHFEILPAPSELPANLLGKFSLSGQQLFLHWAAATLKGLVEFQNKKKLDLFFTIIFNSKMVVSRSEILVHLVWDILKNFTAELQSFLI